MEALRHWVPRIVRESAHVLSAQDPARTVHLTIGELPGAVQERIFEYVRPALKAIGVLGEASLKELNVPCMERVERQVVEYRGGALRSLFDCVCGTVFSVVGKHPKCSTAEELELAARRLDGGPGSPIEEGLGAIVKDEIVYQGQKIDRYVSDTASMARLAAANMERDRLERAVPSATPNPGVEPVGPLNRPAAAGVHASPGVPPASAGHVLTSSGATPQGGAVGAPGKGPSGPGPSIVHNLEQGSGVVGRQGGKGGKIIAGIAVASVAALAAWAWLRSRGRSRKNTEYPVEGNPITASAQHLDAQADSSSLGRKDGRSWVAAITPSRSGVERAL